MKILAVCQYYYPENFQVTPICEQLVRDGHRVTVLTGLPNYPTGVVPEEYLHGRRDETINGVRVLRCHEVGRKKGAVGLARNYLSFLLSAMGKVRTLPGDFDLVLVYQLSPVLMGLPGRWYARAHHVPMVLYCCDLWPESMKMYIKNESNPLFRLMKAVSGAVYGAADRILCQSESFLDYMETTHGIPPSRLGYLPAFADEAYLHEDFTGDNGITDFVFLGNLGIAQNLLRVLEAVDAIRDEPGFRVHLVGDGAVLEDLRSFVRQRGLEERVYFYGRRPVEEMLSFYALADVCLVSLKADDQTGWTLPSKVQGYMAAGKPILGMIDGSARQVIREADCGICVPADDVKGLAAAMAEMIHSPERLPAWGENGRRYFRENFRKEIFMEKLEAEIEKAGREGHVAL